MNAAARIILILFIISTYYTDLKTIPGGAGMFYFPAGADCDFPAESNLGFLGQLITIIQIDKKYN
jgi:hypothetical protein